MSDECKYEVDIKRILRILDGNGQEGLVVKITEMDTKLEQMIEVSNNNVTAINGFNRFMQDVQTKEEFEAQRAKERKQNRHWQVGTVIAFAAMLITLGGFILHVLEKVN